MVYKRKKYHYGDTHLKKQWRTKRRTKDLDEEIRVKGGGHIINKSVYKPKKYDYGDTHLKKKWRTKHRTKDLDEIDADLQPGKADKLLNQEVDLDKPGNAQFYCIHCARYFINNGALQDHFRTKVHKRRLKALELEPYTVEDSERAAGHGSFISPGKRKIETQPSKPEEIPSKIQKVSNS